MTDNAPTAAPVDRLVGRHECYETFDCSGDDHADCCPKTAEYVYTKQTGMDPAKKLIFGGTMDANCKLKRALQEEWEFVGDPWELCHILRRKIFDMADKMAEARNEIRELRELVEQTIERLK